MWTWRAGRAGDKDQQVTVAEPRHVLLAVVSSFILAELGRWAGVWIGATAGLVLADGVAIPMAVAAATAAAVAFLRESSPDPGGPPAGYCPSND